MAPLFSMSGFPSKENLFFIGHGCTHPCHPPEIAVETILSNWLYRSWTVSRVHSSGKSGLRHRRLAPA